MKFYYGTLLFYFLLAFLAPFFALLYTYTLEKKAKIFPLIMLFLILTIPAAIRYGIGTDYTSYEVRYARLVANIDARTSFEFGYLFLNKLFITIGLPFQAIIIVLATLITLFVIKTFLVLPKKVGVLYIFFYMLWAFLPSFSLIRQALAIVIMNYAIILGFNKKPGWFVWYLLIALSFHTSAILIAMVFFLRHLKISNIVILPVLFFLFVIHKKLTLFSFIIGLYPEWLPFSGYFYNTKKLAYLTGGNVESGLGILVMLSFSVLIIMYQKKIIQRYQQGQLFIWIAAVWFVTKMLASEIRIFNRLDSTFIVSFVLVMAYFISAIKTTILRQGVLASFLVFSLYTYSKVASKTYRSLDRGLGVVPYTTIFNKEHLDE